MSNSGAERWRPMAISNPSTRLRAARSMPHWVTQQQQQQERRAVESSSRRPPSPPRSPPPSLTGDCGDPDYEVIEFPPRQQQQQQQQQNRRPVQTNGKILSSVGVAGIKCALCGSENLFARCEECRENYCETCDDMNHKHPKRRGHVRRKILTKVNVSQRPPLPPKGEVPVSPPVPPPRRNRRTTQVKPTLKQGSPDLSLSEKAANYRRGSTGSQNSSNTARPLPATPETQLRPTQSTQSLATGYVEGSGADKMSTLQERYRRYQEAMRAQDASRRRHNQPDNSISSRPSSVGSSRALLTSPPPPPPPPRTMMQSTSVCDLSAPQIWGGGMQQAQSMAQLGLGRMPMMWYPPGTPWDNSLSGSTLSLHHPSMWGYPPMGYHPGQMLPPQYPGTLSRAHSPARSVKSSRRSRAASPSPSLKSRKSLASRSRSRRSPGSPSDASSENSEESDFDDRMSRGSRSLRRGSVTRSRQRLHPEDESNRTLPSRTRQSKWRSEDRIPGVDDRRSEIRATRQDSLPSRNMDSEMGDKNSLQSNQHRYDQSEEEKRNERRKSDRNNSEELSRGGYNNNGNNVRTRQQTSTDEDNFDRRSSYSKGRTKVTSSSDDYVERGERSSVAKNLTREIASGERRRKNIVNSESDDMEKSHVVRRTDSRRSSIDSDTAKRAEKNRDIIWDRKKERKEEEDSKRFEKPVFVKGENLANKSIAKDSMESLKIVKRETSSSTAGETLTEEWSCEHCTFINEAKDRVCAVCYKTKASALPAAATNVNEIQTNSNSSMITISNLEKKMSTLKVSNSEESGDSGSTKNKDESSENIKIDEKNIVNEKISTSMGTSPISSPEPRKKSAATSPEVARKLISVSTITPEIFLPLKESIGKNISTSTSPPPQFNEVKKNFITEESSNVKKSTSTETEISLFNEDKISKNIEKQISGSVTKGTSPPPQSISTQTYDVLPSRGNGNIRKSGSVIGAKGSIYYEDSDSEDGGTSFANSPDLYPPRSSNHLQNQYNTQHIKPSAQWTRRNSIDSSSQRYYNSREPSQSRYVEVISGAYVPPSGQMSTLTRQGLELVDLLRESERQGFSTDDLQVALAQGATNPIEWLKTQWPHLVETVQVLVGTQGNEKKENNVGLISLPEAKEALRQAKGEVWTAVTTAVQRRQRKCAEIMAKGSFAIPEVITALNNNSGNEEAALLELQKNQLKPFLMRIWGPGVGVENEDAAPIGEATGAVGEITKLSDEIGESFEADSRKQRVARRLLAEGKASCYDEAETAASLLALNFSDEEALHAAKECGSVDAALAYLQQECELCTGRFPMSQVQLKTFCILNLLSVFDQTEPQ